MDRINIALPYGKKKKKTGFCRLTDTENRLAVAKWWGCGGQERDGLGIWGSVQFSRSVMSDSLRPHELQHARSPCPSPTPGVHPNPCPLSWWCQPTISFSVVPISSCPQSFPASGSFQMSHQVAKVLESQLQHQSYQWTPRTDLL